MLRIYFGEKVLIALKENARFNLKMLLHVYMYLLSVEKRVMCDHAYIFALFILNK